MSAALAIAAVLSSLAVAAPQASDGVQLLRDACIATHLQRADFERLGRERRWQAQRLTRSSGERGWVVSFRANNALVMLRGGSPRDGDDAGLGASCSVSIDQASPTLEADIAALARSLGLEGEGAVADGPPGFVAPRVWSRFGGHTLTYAAADGRAVISYSRQIVSSDSASPSPSGNR